MMPITLVTIQTTMIEMEMLLELMPRMVQRRKNMGSNQMEKYGTMS